MTQSFWRPRWFKYLWTHSDIIVLHSFACTWCNTSHTEATLDFTLDFTWQLSTCLHISGQKYICLIDSLNHGRREQCATESLGFKLEIPGDSNVKDAIRHKLVSVKKILSTKLNRMANHADALNAVLDAWLKSETANENASQEHGSESQTSHPQPELVQIQIATRDQAKQPQYVTWKTSLE